MNDDNSNAPVPSESEFQDAFASEMGVETPKEEAPAEQAPKEEKSAEEAPKEEAPAEEAPKEEKKPEETPDEEQQGDKEWVTKDDVKAAMREYNQETQGRVESIKSAGEEIIGTMYPEGIDTKIYDSNGQVIKTAQDIVDRGLIKENGDPYTYEEAASFILEAGRQMDENVKELRDYAEHVAEENINLMESNRRVMDKWGDILGGDTKLAEELATEYITTQLTFDKSNSYITKMTMTPERYYDRVLAPYKQLQEARAAQAEQQAQEQREQKTNEQNERMGIPQRGTSQTKPNTGDPNLDALLEELAS